MGTYFDAEMNEVDAFTQAEVDAQVATATETKIKELTDAHTKALSEKETELATANEKLTKRGEEYNHAKTRIKELETASASTTDEVKEAKDKFRNGLIDKIAGDDKEYKEALKSQAERLGFDTLDVTEAEKILKESHTLAQLSLNRDVTSFNMASVSAAGKPPVTGNQGGTDKATDEQVAAVQQAMGGAPIAPTGGMVL